MTDNHAAVLALCSKACICMALERVPEAAVRGKISHQILVHVKLANVGSSLRPTARRISISPG